ncbi:sulfatase family protein [Nostoc sp.]|uniref:sulfatase family protein n=1 Tax=Nostoc sp. TaxID=1180 RepID=UPI002FF89A8C
MQTSSFRTKFFVLIMIGVLVINVLLAAPQKAFAQTNKPNIIFVLVDDMDADTINRNPEKYAPNIKSLLIDKGITFPNFFVNVSLCCPSRTNILRGQYAHNTGVLTNSLPDGGFQKAYAKGLEKETIATSLQVNGYQTALIGKYLNGYPDTASDDTYIPPGWTEWYSPMEKGKNRNDQKKYGNPYDQFNYTLNKNGKLVKYGDKPKDYGTDVYTGFAIDFIQRSVKDSKPFFVYLAPFNIHGPYTPAPRHEKLFPGVKAPRPDNFNEADVSTKPQFMQELPQLNQKQIDDVDESYRKRLRSLQSVDEAVVELVDTLKANGQLDNTYIIFTSDNGYKQGIHRASTGKESAYEEDIRLNLVVRGPGIPAGKKLPQQVGNIDFFPTFTEMAGVKPPAFVDGRSFLPLLKGTTSNLPKWRSAFLIEHKQNQKRRAALENQTKLFQDQSELEDLSELQSLQKGGQVPKIPTYQAIRTQDYTYVEYKTGAKELYNIKKDPYQLNNLASTADPTLLKQLADRLSELHTCKADSCRAIEEQPFTP